MNGKILLFNIILQLLLAPAMGYCQDTLAGWTFPTGQPVDTIADIHNTANTGRSLHPAGGVNTQLSFTNGATTYAATATGWDSGMFQKSWMISFFTTGYYNLSVSSKQRSGGNNPGPRDFIIQYRIGESRTWTDIAGSNVLIANDWSGELQDIALPQDCNDQQPMVFLRWVMTSNTSSNGDPVAATGIGKIDDIFIKGTLVTGLHHHLSHTEILVSPNPARDNVMISNLPDHSTVYVADISGKILLTHLDVAGNFALNINDIPTGIYCIHVTGDNGISVTRKIIKL